jgi:hypothetical protein
MSEEKKIHTENEPALDAGKASLDDKELEDVSGGFTLIDTCQHQWDRNICARALWGACQHLFMNKTGEKAGKIANETYYLVSCDKGCFQNVSHIEYTDRLTSAHA